MAGVFYCSGHESVIIQHAVGHYAGLVSVIIQDSCRSYMFPGAAYESWCEGVWSY